MFLDRQHALITGMITNRNIFDPAFWSSRFLHSDMLCYASDNLHPGHIYLLGGYLFSIRFTKSYQLIQEKICYLNVIWMNCNNVNLWHEYPNDSSSPSLSPFLQAFCRDKQTFLGLIYYHESYLPYIYWISLGTEKEFYSSVLWVSDQNEGDNTIAWCKDLVPWYHCGSSFCWLYTNED